ncbi:MAG: DNA methyltransferase, partial [Bradymonadales bacterium]
MNNDLYEKALRFSKKWEHASYEKGQAQAFLLDFFKIFDLQDYKHPSIPRGFFEHSIQLEGGKQGFIDAYLPNKIMVEMKSQSVGLDKALQQLIQYHSATPRDEQPNLKLLCNFQYFLLIDTEHDIHGARFSLAELPDNIWRFHELVDRERPHISYEQIELDTQASQKMANIHAELRALAYKGHALELSLVRLLFCMFAEDTGIFPQFSFTCLVEKSKADGSDLHHLLNDLFEALDTPDSARHGDEYFAKFAYVNGGLFSEAIRFPRFNKKLREVLIDCCYFDWRKISPAIFGALFQGIMDEDERRQDGVHYTSEENILKVLNPLFLNALNERFEKIRNDNKKLEAFHQRLRGIKLLDPACGCGNFLLIAYRELRRLENRVIEQKLKGQATLFTRAEIRVDVDQCYGIELKAFPCEIARVALWLMDHLMMLETQKIVASYSPASNVDLRIPLTSSAKIVEANALTIDWQSLIDEENQHFDYIFGNPPFGGARHMSKAQKEDMKRVFAGCHHVGNIDYVGAWFYIAAQYMQNTATATAFVATNSISQGALVDILWSPILALGAEIDFAYRSFKWSNEAAGQAAVYCVIVGFSKKKSHHKKRIFEATNSISAKNINPYLVDAPNVLIQLRDEPINTAPKMIFGSMPNDGGHLIIEKSDYEEFVNKEPQALAYIRPLLGSREFLQKKERWCLWLVDAKPEDLRRCPLVLKRIEKVRE